MRIANAVIQGQVFVNAEGVSLHRFISDRLRRVLSHREGDAGFGTAIAAQPGDRCALQSSPEGASGMTERRMARRYDLSLPVNIRLPINLEPKSDSGQTRDISTRGVYFTAHKDLAPGTELDFTLTLPAEITRGSEVFVRAHGRVVRVDRRSDDDHETIGVAAVIERYDIVRGEGARI